MHMKATLESQTILNVTVAYEDFPASKRVREMLDQFGKFVGPAQTLSCCYWKFDMLAMPKLGRLAALGATAGELIVISSTNPGEPAFAVKLWIQQCLANSECRARMLISLCESPNGDAEFFPAVSSYCREIAERAGMAFLSDRDLQQPDEVGFDFRGLRHLAGANRFIRKSAAEVRQRRPPTARLASRNAQ
ncbi:MAG: hypothetical protein HY301_06125 [Verrucomicrobia bacterium]|nr:hypothetical protein [Verrucomicrobiota bacterium]